LLLARITTILPRYLPVNSTFHALLACISRTAVELDESRGCEDRQAGFGDFLGDTGVRGLKGEHDSNKEVDFVDTICNSA